MKKITVTILSILLIFSVTLYKTSSVNAQTFPDVDPNTEVGRAVEKLYKLGIVLGKPDGTYAQKDTITRAEAAKIMYGIMELDGYDNTTGTQYFSDVATSHWAYKEIATISDWGVMNGYGNGKFGPTDGLTRGQMAVILRAALNLPNGPTTLPFKDVSPKSYYFAGVASLYGSEITKGKSATSYDPDGFVTRAELAQFLDRSGVLDELLENSDEEFDIVDIASVDGKIIDEVRFRQILTNNENDIWGIFQLNFNNPSYYNEETKTFENLNTGESVFEINFNQLDYPVYLKVHVNEDLQASYEFITVKSLIAKANKLNGTKILTDILKQLIDENPNINENYLAQYLSIDNDESLSYYTYLGDCIFYFEINDTPPFILTYNFNDNIEGEILISPTKVNGSIDFTAQLLN